MKSSIKRIYPGIFNRINDLKTKNNLVYFFIYLKQEKKIKCISRTILNYLFYVSNPVLTNKDESFVANNFLSFSFICMNTLFVMS